MLPDLLALHKVNIITGACVKEITEEGVIIVGESSNQTVIKADTIVMATGLKSNNELYRALTGRFTHLYAVGDCQEPRNIMGAIWDGYEVGRAV